ncbi:MAG: anti-sigma factor family protein [Betaproteobacteria bacterium]
MTETHCSYPGDRDGVLVAYLYDDIDPSARASFEAHLMTCVTCHGELDALRGVRSRLGRWAPPEPAHAPAAASPARAWWREIPVWAQVAAALLVLGVSAGIANLDVRYDQSGLSIRTGWSRPTVSAQAASPVAAPADAPWRGDLAAFEQRLRTEFHAADVGVVPTPVAAAGRPPAPALDEADVLRRVRELVNDSERRQERELALRIAQVVRDVDVQRRADLVKIDRSLGQVQSNTGIEVLRQRELLNYLVRVSQKQ